ncbi:MAG TPA: TPM domain-containing protein [Flavobacterium sp.]|jgi:uncharacterized protein
MRKIVFIICLLTFSNVWCQKGKIKDVSLKPIAIEHVRQTFWNNLPKPLNWVNDYEGLYTEEQEAGLNKTINKFEAETTIEIAIVTIDTLKVSKNKFEDLSLHIATTWGVGKKNKDNGILIAISKGYRVMRIQNGNGIEKIITDEETKQIIDNYFILAFKMGNYFEGTLNGLQELIRLIKTKINRY